MSQTFVQLVYISLQNVMLEKRLSPNHESKITCQVKELCSGHLFDISIQDTRLKHTFTYIIACPTAWGKMTFVTCLLRYVNPLINEPFERLLRCYDEWQSMYAKLTETIPKVECARPDIFQCGQEKLGGHRRPGG